MASNYNIIKVEAEEIEYQHVNITFSILRVYTTLYLTYQLLYCTGHIQMTSNYSTVEVQAEEIKYKNVNTSIYILRIYTALYYTYQL